MLSKPHRERLIAPQFRDTAQGLSAVTFCMNTTPKNGAISISWRFALQRQAQARHKLYLFGHSNQINQQCCELNIPGVLVRPACSSHPHTRHDSPARLIGKFFFY